MGISNNFCSETGDVTMDSWININPSLQAGGEAWIMKWALALPTKTRSAKYRRPFVIHYYESFETKSEAAKRKYFFKSIAGYNYLKSNGII
jgi:hypothetical protein